MLNKKNRLLIKGRLESSKIITSPLFTLKIIKSQDKEVKFAITVGKSVDKRAVYRNKLKRKYTEAIKNIIKKVELGHNFLVIAKKEALGKTIAEIEEELTKKIATKNL